jgi:hypothetical protein
MQSYRSYQSLVDRTCPLTSYLPFSLETFTLLYKRMAIADIRKEHFFFKQTWEKTVVRDTLRHQILSTPSCVLINKIVCFGLGSFSIPDAPYHPPDDYRARHHVQTAAIQTIISALIEKHQRENPRAHKLEIPCYVQDPAYQPADKKFLKELGLILVNDPKGFLKVDKNTLFYTVAPNEPIRQIIADVQWPGGLICDTIPKDAGEEDKGKWAKLRASPEESAKWRVFDKNLIKFWDRKTYRGRKMTIS